MRRIFAFFLVAVFLYSGCSQTQIEGENNGKPIEQLVVYTSHRKEIYGPIIKEFQERTGIWVQVYQGGSNELIKKLQEEREAPVCDVFFGGSIEIYETYSEYFEVFRCKEEGELQSEFVPQSGKWTAFSRLPIVIAYNTNLLDETQAPDGWISLTDSMWKGKIAFASPSVSASCYTSLATIVQISGENGWSNLQKFKENIQGFELGSSSEMLEAVASGVFPVGIVLEEVALRLIADGEPVEIVYPKEGTSVVPDASGIVKGTPHIENAQLFINHTVSRDMQNMISSQYYRRPVRVDINPPQGAIKLEELVWQGYSMEWSIKSREEVLRQWES